MPAPMVITKEPLKINRQNDLFDQTHRVHESRAEDVDKEMNHRLLEHDKLQGRQEASCVP